MWIRRHIKVAIILMSSADASLYSFVHIKIARVEGAIFQL